MSRRRNAILPFLVLGGAVLLGGWFLQEGVERDENVYVQVRVFQEVVDHVTTRFVDEVERDGLYESAIEGVLEGLEDPNTSFIPAQAYENFQIRATEGEYGGVGLEVVERDGWVTVVAPIPGTPAARAGIRPGDWFVGIEGEDVEGWDVDRAVDVLRGEPGTSVDVMIGRPGVDEPIPFTLDREVIRLRSVPFATRLDGDLGYVPLRIFRTSSADEVRAAVDSLVADGIRGLVLDLRGNPGGLLDEGIGVSELFLPRGSRIVQTRGRARGQNETFSASREPAYPDLPVVVLVDGTSASASEIVAGALQDHDRAVLVGLTSYGKGSVQTLYRLSGGNVLRLTTARWYTPVGRTIDRVYDREAPLARGGLTLSGMLLPEDSEAERPTFESEGGRTLLGGGGIVPDVRVVPDTLSTEETRAVRALYRQAGAFTNALFSFAGDYLRANPDAGAGVRVDDDVLADFRRHLREREVGIADEVFRDASRYIRYQLGREIALQAGGEPAEFEQVRPQDRQLQRALELLDAARTTSELLQTAGSGVPAGAGSDAGGS